ncbi:NlpC/P60 family protein [Kribbella amoyensis]|uniref:NlpC/P60 family protein n=1 Tax=Kribbella amoyensis TaxID=996641 RepID=A0A561BR95_9ACTN|nr:NlpC/P60 family protein [Kribbella amoyensis]TWD81369.1 NlpC/P60 family protein [Kribbella amoyensis]
MRRSPARRCIVTVLTAFVTTVAGSAVVATPAASTAGLSNPSATLTVKCPGVKAFVQVDWRGANQVTVRWRLDDTAADRKSPVLRIQAVNAKGSTASMVFPGGNPHYGLDGGKGSHKVGLKSGWNPGNLADINHLKVLVRNGNTEQGTSCKASRNIFNWSRIAYTTAVSKKDKKYKKYKLGGVGPDYYDCSGLLLTSYNKIGLFPDFDLSKVRTAEQIYDWARTHTSPGKVYAQKIRASEAKVGDLLFYEKTAPSSRDITHVAFWAGDNTLYDALSPQAGIGFHANSAWWTQRLVAVYRILGVSTDG